jgi:hypothetical protein
VHNAAKIRTATIPRALTTEFHPLTLRSAPLTFEW